MNWFMAILLREVRAIYQAIVAYATADAKRYKEISAQLEEILSRLPPLVVDVTLEGSVDPPVQQ